MNRFISGGIKILIFLLLLVATDQVLGLIIRKFYFRQHTGRMHAFTYALRDCKADILVFGASNAQHSYDPRIFRDSLNMSCYNAGQDGGHSIILQYAQIKAITERYTPKMIILDFHPKNIVHYPGDYNRLYILSPYYRDYPVLHPFVLLRGPYEKLKLISAIYPFNSQIIDIIRYNTNTHSARVKDFEGYIPLKKVMSIDMYNTDFERETQSVVDENMVNALRNVIKICKEKNISLFIVSSPLYRKVNERQIFTSSFAEISLGIINSEGANYLDFAFDPVFSDKMELFTDQNHLNENGATLFTQNLTGKLKNYKLK